MDEKQQAKSEILKYDDDDRLNCFGRQNIRIPSFQEIWYVSSTTNSIYAHNKYNLYCILTHNMFSYGNSVVSTLLLLIMFHDIYITQALPIIFLSFFTCK